MFRFGLSWASLCYVALMFRPGLYGSNDNKTVSIDHHDPMKLTAGLEFTPTVSANPEADVSDPAPPLYKFLPHSPAYHLNSLEFKNTQTVLCKKSLASFVLCFMDVLFSLYY